MRTILLFILGGVCYILSSCQSNSLADVFPNHESLDYFKQAELYEDQGELEMAVIYYNKADSMAPNSPVILNERGLVLTRLERYDEAIADFDRAIKLTDDLRLKRVRMNNRGVAYQNAGRMKECCSDFKRSGREGRDNYRKFCQKQADAQQ